MEKFLLPLKIEKEVITVRLPTDTLVEIGRLAARFDVSRNEFVNQCIAFALANMENAETDAEDDERAQ